MVVLLHVLLIRDLSLLLDIEVLAGRCQEPTLPLLVQLSL